MERQRNPGSMLEPLNRSHIPRSLPSGAFLARPVGSIRAACFLHPPLQGEGRPPQVVGVGCAATPLPRAPFGAVTPPAALRATTSPSRGGGEQALAIPPHGRDPRVVLERLPVKIDCRLRHRAKRSSAVAAQKKPPGLARHRLGAGECPAREYCDVQPMQRVAHRGIFDDRYVTLARQLGKRLAFVITRDMHPNCGPGIERRPRQINRSRSRIVHGEGGVFAGGAGPSGVRRFGEKQQPVKAEFGDRRMRVFGAIKHAQGPARFPKPGSSRVGRVITERRRQQEVQMPAFARDRRFCFLDEELQRVLFCRRVGQFCRRYLVLGLDDPPALSRRGAAVRR